MNFVADENIDIEIIDHLRNAGYEVFSISEEYPGVPDEDVIKTDLPGLINNVSPFVITIFAPFAILSLCLRHFLSVVKLQGVLLALH